MPRPAKSMDLLPVSTRQSVSIAINAMPSFADIEARRLGRAHHHSTRHSWHQQPQHASCLHTAVAVDTADTIAIAKLICSCC
jgi:hypothetical protein